MRSRELLRRLARLGSPDEAQPNTVIDSSGLSRIEECRLMEIWAHREEGVTEADVAEYRTLMGRCRLVEPSEAGHRERETREEKRERRKLEIAFGGAFHDYAMQYPYIATPNYYNALNEYRHDLGYRLFEKYGWLVGERNCSGILPLDQWAPEDRGRLIDLYQRSNPECTAEFPPGWKSQHKVGRVF
jgi:hypothetical protein